MSPDGTEIVVTRCEKQSDLCGVYVMNSDGTDGRLLFGDEETGMSFMPTFSSDGSELYFLRYTPAQGESPAAGLQLYGGSSTGANGRQLTDIENMKPCEESEGSCNIGIRSVGGGPSISPDGASLIFSFEGDLLKVATNAVDAKIGLGITNLTNYSSSEDATWPSYNPDGSILYYYRDALDSVAPGLYEMSSTGESVMLVEGPGGTDGLESTSYSPAAESIAYLHDGVIYVSDKSGGQPNRVSDGDEAYTLRQALGNDGPEAEEKAGEVEGELQLLSDSVGNIEVPFLNVKLVEGYFCSRSIQDLAECAIFSEDKIMLRKCATRYLPHGTKRLIGVLAAMPFSMATGRH